MMFALVEVVVASKETTEEIPHRWSILDIKAILIKIDHGYLLRGLFRTPTPARTSSTPTGPPTLPDKLLQPPPPVTLLVLSTREARQIFMDDDDG